MYNLNLKKVSTLHPLTEAVLQTSHKLYASASFWTQRSSFIAVVIIIISSRVCWRSLLAFAVAMAMLSISQKRSQNLQRPSDGRRNQSCRTWDESAAIPAVLGLRSSPSVVPTWAGRRRRPKCVCSPITSKVCRFSLFLLFELFCNIVIESFALEIAFAHTFLQFFLKVEPTLEHDGASEHGSDVRFCMQHSGFVHDSWQIFLRQVSDKLSWQKKRTMMQLSDYLLFGMISRRRSYS